MRVLILANNDVGLYKFRKELIQELIYPGSIINGRKEKPYQVCISLPDGEFVPKLEKMGCIFISTPVDRRGMNPVKDLKLLNQYRTIVKKVKPDVVLTYTIKPNIYGGFVCGFKKIPYISNITGLGTSIESNSFMSKIILLMYKIGLHSASTVFFQNKENELLFEKTKIIKSKGKLIPGSGVNLLEHCLEDYPQETGESKFLFVGRIMKDKGICEYLDCAEYIHKKYPNTIFNIVGPYDEDAYKSRIEDLHRKGIVRYFGQQDNVHTFIKENHAVILPSYHEGLSNVLLESAAAGRPVLASNVPGCKETFDNGVTGIGFTPQSSQALIEAVETFLELPFEKKRQMGIKARDKIEREFDKKLVIQSYLAAMDKTR